MTDCIYHEIITLTVLENQCSRTIDLCLKETKVPNVCSLELRLFDTDIKIESDNFWDCLSELKKLHPNVLLCCKGYKKNVYPSRMSYQMSRGLKAYETEWGKPATFEQLVSIFAPETENLTSSLGEQKDYFDKWFDSLA